MSNVIAYCHHARQPFLPAAEHAPEYLQINTCRGEGYENLGTDDTTAATLSDHLIRSMLIAQHCAAGVDSHHTVKAVDGRCATTLSGWLLAQCS